MRLKKEPLPFVLCPTEGPPRGVLPVASNGPRATVMTHVLTVRHDLPVEALGAAFVDPRVTAVVVVDDDGVAIGFVTRKTYRDNLQ
ncbi:MAG: CBS domain-containing protein [Myxococcaceae bacterium]|nr:CBS domain-containing protein [Myxococcaceae bacterium]